MVSADGGVQRFRSRVVGAEAVAEQMTRMYGPTFLAPRQAEPLLLDHAGAAEDRVMINRTRVNAGIGGRVLAHAHPVMMARRAGHVTIREPLTGTTGGARGWELFPVGLPLDFVIGPADIDIVQISRDALHSAVHDVDPDAGPPRLDHLRPLHPPFAGAWRAALAQVRRVLESDELYAAPLVRESAVAHLAAVTVVAFGLIEEPSAHSGLHHRLVAVAQRFIDEHLDQPLTVAAVARACTVSVRTLQAAFRSVLDTTPANFVRERRLSAAHDDLLRADPVTETVRNVALRWGFANPGRFAADYRRSFDEPPRVTLRR